MLTSLVRKVQYALSAPLPTLFDIPFKYWAKSEIVAKLSFDDGVTEDQTLVQDIDYSLSSPGGMGVLTRLTEWNPEAVRITIYRVLIVHQDGDIRNGDAIDADSLELLLDRMVAISQQIDEASSRQVRVPITDTPAIVELPPKEVRALHHLACDEDGDIIVSAGVPDVPTSPFASTLLDDPDAEAMQKTLGLIPGGASAAISAFIQSLLDDDGASAVQSTLGISEFIKSLLDDADAKTAQKTLGMIPGGASEAISAFIQSLLDDGSAAEAQSSLGISEFIKTMLDDANAATARATLGIMVKQAIIPGSLIGDALSLGMGESTTALAAMNSTDVAVLHPGTTNNWGMYRFSGAKFALLGSLFSRNNSQPALCKLSSSRTAAKLGGVDLYCHEFNGSTWAQVGNPFTIAGSNFACALCRMQDNDVAHVDVGTEGLRYLRFDGTTDWSQIGNTLNVGVMGTTVALAGLTATDVAFLDGDQKELRTYRFNGSDWTLLGSGLSVPVGASLKMCALSSTDVLIMDSTNASLLRYRFNGSTWMQIAAPFNPGGFGSIAAFSELEVAHFNMTGDTLQRVLAPASVDYLAVA